jgi:hypothetical protein
MAFGQVGGIGMYVDTPTYVDCDFLDTGNALVPIYCVAKYNAGSTASQWMMVTGGGWNCTYTGEIVAMPTSIGGTQTGISLGYGGCQVGDLLLVTVNFFCMGISPTCAYLEIIGDPSSGSNTVEVVDCAYVRFTHCPGSKLYANPDVTCDVCGLPTHETSWGKIKTLYGE